MDDELSLKQRAAGKGLLVMGPDCGSSLIGGVGIGFTNAVRKGPIGLIAAAGTGLQEFTSQVHNAGFGISHAIGTGGRDLSDRIGGLTTFAALDALEADAQTKVIAVISKPPGTKTRARLIERFKTCTKQVVACFLGAPGDAKETPAGFRLACTIDGAVRTAVQLAGGEAAPGATFSAEELERISDESAAWSAGQKYLRGLLAGGTFCYQSQQILRDAGVVVRSNAPLDAKYKLADSNCSVEHSVIDMGSDEYTVARPHPMIDGTLRRQRILAESRDPQVAILLLDFILGFNSSMDPVGELLDAILDARQIARKRGSNLTIVASICGTDGDPQDVTLQTKMLKEAGVIVFSSNAKAASFCAHLAQKSGEPHGIFDR